MEKVQGINPQRIVWCCEEYGITSEQLAMDIKIATSTLESVLAGGDALTVNQLKRLAARFNRGMLFFLESGPVESEEVYSPQFRTLTNQKAQLTGSVRAIVERVERQRQVYLDLLDELGDTDRPTFAPPELAKKSPKAAAMIARDWLDLDETNDFQRYRRAVEQKGILVFRSNAYRGAWKISKEDRVVGFSLYDTVCPVIVVKKEAAETRQSFTLMHELGHILLDHKSAIDDERDLYDSHKEYERRANAFAGHLLVPDAFLSRIDDNKRPDRVSDFDHWLKAERHDWGVSTEVILRRLVTVGRLDDSQYRAYRRYWSTKAPKPSERGSRWRHREPKHIFGDTYVRTVMDALSANRITLNKASTYLDNIKIQDLHKLEQHYAGL